MKGVLTIISIILLVIFNINYNLGQSVSGVVIKPFLHNCGENLAFGVGYFLPFSQCIQFESNYFYVVLSSDRKHIQTYFLQSCDNPLNFTNSISYKYELLSCQVFKVPNAQTFISYISITAEIPFNAVIYDYVYDSLSCLGDDFKVFYTNDYAINIAENESIQYQCNGSTPLLTQCLNYKCQTIDLGLEGCQNHTETGYSYSISCYTQ